MSDPILRISEASATSSQDVPIPLGRVLIEQNLITPWQLFYAVRCQRLWNATLAEILVSRGWISQSDLLNVLSVHVTAQKIDLTRQPPDSRLAGFQAAPLSPEFCVKHCILPWAQVGGLLILATGRPDRIPEMRCHLPPAIRGALIVTAPEQQVLDHLTRTHSAYLTNLAESRVANQHSCRSWGQKPGVRSLLVIGLIGTLVLLSLLMPRMVLGGLMIWALLSLFVASLLKAAAFALKLWHWRAPPPPKLPPGARLPRISVMVPLIRETEIAHALVSRLTRLTYPRALLDVVLVLEEEDTLTQKTLAQTRLPKWMRVVHVPAGSGLTTKPRALNYALDFCKGDIIGIWDAEDAPAPDQLEQVARHFARAAPDVACLQGILDYYNPYTNWLSRCFTIEYATWFRIILPGMARLGFAIPLGGTTLFLRRDAVEAVRGWDAHNVTEDADLGYRLSRFGYRTELMQSVTQEEANCRPIAWIRQRSRWLKGFMVTYLVHMRNPVRLWRDLGALKFVGFHMVFMTTLTQFILAPLIWSFWLAAFGMPHPLSGIFGPEATRVIASLMVCAGVLSALIALVSVSGQGRERLYPYVLTMALYFSLATLAAYKALIELVIAPYYWDKTAHGKTAEGTQALLPAQGKAHRSTRRTAQRRPKTVKAATFRSPDAAA